MSATMAGPSLDHDASLSRLSDWLRARRENTFDFAEESRRYRGLADRLTAMAATLDDSEWEFLECEFDKDPPPEPGLDGYPIPCPISNAARFRGLVWRLRDLAAMATQMADANPKPRTKPELPIAADFFLHLWLAAGYDKPTLYDKGPAVLSLKAALEDAGYPLSDERVRGLLTNALEKFDPHFCLDQWQLDRLFVWRQ